MNLIRTATLCLSSLLAPITSAAEPDAVERALSEVRDVKADLFSRQSSVLGTLPGPAEMATHQMRCRTIPQPKAGVSREIRFDAATRHRAEQLDPVALRKEKGRMGMRVLPLGITGAYVTEILGHTELVVVHVLDDAPATGILRPDDIILGANGLTYAKKLLAAYDRLEKHAAATLPIIEQSLQDGMLATAQTQLDLLDKMLGEQREPSARLRKTLNETLGDGKPRDPKPVKPAPLIDQQELVKRLELAKGGMGDGFAYSPASIDQANTRGFEGMTPRRIAGFLGHFAGGPAGGAVTALAAHGEETLPLITQLLGDSHYGIRAGAIATLTQIYKSDSEEYRTEVPPELAVVSMCDIYLSSRPWGAWERQQIRDRVGELGPESLPMLRRAMAGQLPTLTAQLDRQIAAKQAEAAEADKSAVKAVQREVEALEILKADLAMRVDELREVASLVESLQAERPSSQDVQIVCRFYVKRPWGNQYPFIKDNCSYVRPLDETQLRLARDTMQRWGKAALPTLRTFVDTDKQALAKALAALDAEEEFWKPQWSRKSMLPLARIAQEREDIQRISVELQDLCDLVEAASTDDDLTEEQIGVLCRIYTRRGWFVQNELIRNLLGRAGTKTVPIISEHIRNEREALAEINAEVERTMSDTAKIRVAWRYDRLIALQTSLWRGIEELGRMEHIWQDAGQ